MILRSFLWICLAQGDEANGDYGDFWTWPEIVGRVEELQKKYPTLLHRTSLGRTVEGRDILLLKISDNAAADEDEPELLLMAGIHPREQQPQLCLMRLLEELLDGYGKDERLTRLVNERQVWIIPVFNVDGKVYDMKHGNGKDKGAGWRKNRRPNANGAIGVDLNRNFPVRWGGSSDDEKTIVFEGPEPLSEPETKALAKFFDERPLRAFVDLHSNMKAIFHAGFLIRPEFERFRGLTKKMQELQKDPYRTTPVTPDADPPAEKRPGNTGLTNAWSYYTRGVYSFIFEIAGTGFYQKPDEVRREYEDNIRGPLLHLIEACADLPLAKKGSAALKEGKLEQNEWTPIVQGDAAYGVLVCEGAEVEVISEYRTFPTKRGFTLRVAKRAPQAPMALYLWDSNRGLSIARFNLKLD